MTRYILSALLLFTMKWSLAQTTCHPSQCAILLHGSAIVPSGLEDNTMYYFTYPLEGICVDDLNVLLPTLNEHWGSFVYSHMSSAERQYHEQDLGGTDGKPSGVYGVSWCVSQEEANSTLSGYERRGRIQKLNYAPSDLLQELARCSKTGSTNANDEGINSPSRQSESSNPSVRESGKSDYPTYRENMAKLNRLEQKGIALEQQWSDYWATQRAMDDERARQKEERERQRAEAQKKYWAERWQSEQAQREYASEVNRANEAELEEKIDGLYKKYPEDERGISPKSCSICNQTRDAVLDYQIRKERIKAEHFTDLLQYESVREGTPKSFVEDRQFHYNENAALVYGSVALQGLFWPGHKAAFPWEVTHVFDLATGRFVSFEEQNEGYSQVTVLLNGKQLDELPHEALEFSDKDWSKRWRKAEAVKQRQQMSYAFWHQQLKEERGLSEAAVFLLQNPSAQGLKVFKEIYPQANTSAEQGVRELFSDAYHQKAKHFDDERMAWSRYNYTTSLVENNKDRIMAIRYLNLLNDAFSELLPFLRSMPLEQRAQIEKQHKSLKEKLSSQILVYKLDDKNSGQSVWFPFTHQGLSMEMTLLTYYIYKEDGKPYYLGTPFLWKSNFEEINEICPDGWRLPTASELLSFVEGQKRHYGSLTETKQAQDLFHFVFYNHFDVQPNNRGESFVLITDEKKKKLRAFVIRDMITGTASGKAIQAIEPEVKLRAIGDNYLFCKCVREKQ